MLSMKQQNKGLEAQSYCAKIKIRAERRAGYTGRVGKESGPKEENPSHDVTGSQPALEELGITRNQSCGIKPDCI